MKEQNQREEKREEKREAGAIAVKGGFLTWIENVWYHYKWPILVVTFFVVLGLVCFAQCGTREAADLTVAYAGGYTLTGADREGVADALEAAMKAKQTGEKSESVMIATFSVFTDEEMRALSTDSEGKLSVSSYGSMKNVSDENFRAFSSYVMTGESAVWLISEHVYEQMNLDEVSVPLAELYGEAPKSAYDGYAIRLADTELYRYYDALKVLPKDTLILLPRNYLWGESADEESYAQFEALFRAIVEFKAP